MSRLINRSNKRTRDRGLERQISNSSAATDEIRNELAHRDNFQRPDKVARDMSAHIIFEMQEAYHR